MGLLDALFGRKKLPPSKTDRLSAIASAELTLRTEAELESSGQMGVAVRGVAASHFAQVRADLERLLALAAEDMGSRSSVHTDEFGFVWVVVSDPDFPDLVAAAQVSAETLAQEGYRDQLLCAVFPFVDSERRPLHIVYSFKRAAFYAFAPGPGKKRDLALELRIHSLLEGELPLERELEYRYPLWGIPVGPDPG